MNKQLFENSGLAELFAADGGQRDEIPFFNSKDPNLAVLHEKPEHRLMALVKLQGASNREIARQTGYTEAWVSQVMRQPWMRRLLANLMAEAGVDEVRTLLKSTQIDSVYKLMELRDSEDSPPAVVRGCCTDLLEQYSGKPTTRVEVQHKPLSDPSDIAELDRQINELAAETNRLTGKT